MVDYTQLIEMGINASLNDDDVNFKLALLLCCNEQFFEGITIIHILSNYRSLSCEQFMDVTKSFPDKSHLDLAFLYPGSGTTCKYKITVDTVLKYELYKFSRCDYAIDIHNSNYNSISKLCTKWVEFNEKPIQCLIHTYPEYIETAMANKDWPLLLACRIIYKHIEFANFIKCKLGTELINSIEYGIKCGVDFENTTVSVISIHNLVDFTNKMDIIFRGESKINICNTNGGCSFVKWNCVVDYDFLINPLNAIKNSNFKNVTIDNHVCNIQVLNLKYLQHLISINL